MPHEREPRAGHGPPPRGRGAASNPPGRFATRETEPFDDGWGGEESAGRLETVVTPEATRTILTRNDSPDVPFEVSINPYKGCEHGCSYCFARPTHAYLDLSPGLDFETRIFSKPDAPARLRESLSRKGYPCRPIALGANTDPYQPVERDLRITRRILEVLADTRHPFSIVTKSNLVLRDLDLLAPVAARGLTRVFLSVTTLDRDLARRMEPRAPTPQRRLLAIRRLVEAGVPAGVLASPMIPGINDHELERILEAAAEVGASTASYILVRLPWEVKRVFRDWLETHYPDRATKVLHRIEQMRGGRLNDPRFGTRMVGEGPWAKLLERRFETSMRRLGLARRSPELDCSQFRPPAGSEFQPSLFE